MQPKGDGECKSTIVLPAVIHVWLERKYLSELGAFLTSKVKIVPSGRSVQPSSELKSLLPVKASAVQVRVTGSSAAICISSFLPTRNLPSGRTTDCESPIKSQPAGGASEVQVL